MKRVNSRGGIPLLTGLLGLGGGFALGQRQGLDWGMQLLQSEVRGNLSVHVEVASSIRVGDAQRALSFLDDSIDAAVLSLAAQPDQAQMQSALGQAKLYRRVVSPHGRSASEVTDALARVPVPTAPLYCPPRRGMSAETPSGLLRLVQAVKD
jgi:hypothetical protein